MTSSVPGQNTTASSFLKWPGGKRSVLPEIRKYVPEKYNTYYEPFVGGGAVMFDIAAHKNRISDINPELINTYLTVKEDHEALLSKLEEHQANNSQDYFYQIRSLDRDVDTFSSLTHVERAARTIYLNKTCFNGLNRVNKKGYFNAPYGFYKNPPIVNHALLESVSTWMVSRDIEFKSSDFITALIPATTGDFIYLDPPYIPLTRTASFTGYASGGFGMDEQELLMHRFSSLDEEGALVMSSNSDTPQTRELYQNFTIMPIQVSRRISAKTSGRAPVGEVIILGHTLAEAVL
jgi:DNA adenine methylase